MKWIIAKTKSGDLQFVRTDWILANEVVGNITYLAWKDGGNCCESGICFTGDLGSWSDMQEFEMTDAMKNRAFKFEQNVFSDD